METYSITLDASMVQEEIPEEVKRLKELQKKGLMEIFTTEKDLEALAIDHLTAHPAQKMTNLDFEKIKEIVYPGISRNQLDFNQLRYVMFLAAHISYKRDIFVTNDETLNSKKKELEGINIKVMTCEECFNLVNKS